MSTEITTIFDAINTAIDTVCQGESYTELYWPIDLVENDDLTLRKGYGWFFSGSGNNEFFNSRIRAFNRSFTVVLTSINRATKLDTASRKTTEKSLLETQRNLIAAFENDSTISCNVGPITFLGDGGFETLEDASDNVIVLNSEFSFEYKVNL